MKHYNQGYALNQKIIEGVDILADNVATTLGPRGRNVALYHKEQNVPVITKDGVTVAKFIELEDPFQNLGAQVIKQAAEQSVLWGIHNILQRRVFVAFLFPPCSSVLCHAQHTPLCEEHATRSSSLKSS